MRIRDWSSDVCSSDLKAGKGLARGKIGRRPLVPRRVRQRFHPGQLFIPIGGGKPVQGSDQLPYIAGKKPLFGGSVRRVFQQVFVKACQPRALVGAHLTKFLKRSEEHTSELQSLMRISYAVFCLKKKNK